MVSRGKMGETGAFRQDEQQQQADQSYWYSFGETSLPNADLVFRSWGGCRKTRSLHFDSGLESTRFELTRAGGRRTLTRVLCDCDTKQKYTCWLFSVIWFALILDTNYLTIVGTRGYRHVNVFSSWQSKSETASNQCFCFADG